MNVALLGTGLLGQAVADRLQPQATATAYNRSHEKTASLRQRGIRIAPMPKRPCPVQRWFCFYFGRVGHSLRAVRSRPPAGRITRRTIIQMGTIGPAESRSIQQEIERVGGRYLEAPVLGSIAEAHAGTLLIMVGATPEHYAEYVPLLRSLGSEVHLIGPVGKAAMLKLALNQLIAAEMAAFALSLGLVRREGVAVESFMGGVAKKRFVRADVRQKTVSAVRAELRQSKLFHAPLAERCGVSSQCSRNHTPSYRRTPGYPVAAHREPLLEDWEPWTTRLSMRRLIRWKPLAVTVTEETDPWAGSDYPPLIELSGRETGHQPCSEQHHARCAYTTTGPRLPNSSPTA